MNPRITSAFGIVALLGLIFHLAPPSAENPAAPVRDGTKQDATSEPAAERAEGPATATCRYFGKKPTDRYRDFADSDDDQIRELFCLPHDSRIHIEFRIATIPDPALTRLGYFTDRSLESLFRAAQAAGWDFDSQWLPWKRGKNGDGERTWLESGYRYPEPGVLLFRKRPDDGGKYSENMLLIFIAGETPTGGIESAEILKALRYGWALAANDVRGNIAIAGPTFSGSFDSLLRAILGFRRDQTLRFTVASGTVTNDAYESAFVNASTCTRPIRFFRTIYGADQTREALGRLGHRLGIGAKEIAILAEDETAAFSQAPKLKLAAAARGWDGIRTIHFPREISSLRNAYREAAQNSPQSAGPASGPLPLSLHDSDTGVDSAPLFARSYTPQTQYAAVSSIVESLRDTKLVEIEATNVLDALFLAGVIRDGSAGTRILVPEPDLLFVRAAREQSLSGILALTPYPLLLRSQRWTPLEDRRDIMVFADSRAQSMYNAALMLLAPESGEELRDYGDPFDTGQRQPALWLAEETMSGYWPVDVIPASRAGLNPSAKPTATAFQMPVPPRIWWLCGAILALTNLGAVFAKYKARMSLTVAPAGIRHASWFLGALLCSIGIAIALCLPLAVKFPADGSRSLVAIVLPLAASLIALELFWVRTCHETAADWPLGGRLALAAVPLLAMTAPFLFIRYPVTPAITLMAFRALQLTSGCSPAVPLMLLFSAAALFFLTSKRRTDFGRLRDPGIPAEGLAEAARESIRHFEARIGSMLCGGLSAGGSFGAAGKVASLLTLVFLFLTPWKYLQTVDGKWYRDVLFVAAFLLLLQIGYSAALFYRVWGLMKSLLSELDRLPMAGAFRRLPHQFSHLPIWRGLSVAPSSFTTFFRGCECIEELCRVSLMTAVPEELRFQVRYHARELAKARALVRDSERTGEAAGYRAVAPAALACADFLLADILVPYWKEYGEDPDPGVDSVPPKTKDEAPETGPAAIYRLASRFVALRFAVYIRYVMMQLRNLIVFVSVGFLLLTLALSSLDFQSPSVIRWFLVAVFVAAGTPCVRVLIQMGRDAVLNRLADQSPGELHGEAILRLAVFGTLPLVGVLSNQFPAFSRFLFSWLQPALANVK